MISIITAAHNQLPMNQLFVQHLKEATRHPYELIVIDNASTDGSANFFESIGATVIRNPVNYSYPHSQNQGVAKAQYDWLAFLNNDIMVSPGWDQVLVNTMLNYRIVDVLVHTWDLAKSIGVSVKLDEHVALRAWNGLQPLAPTIGQIGAFGSGPSGVIGVDAPIQDRLLDLVGRNVRD